MQKTRIGIAIIGDRSMPIRHPIRRIGVSTGSVTRSKTGRWDSTDRGLTHGNQRTSNDDPHGRATTPYPGLWPCPATHCPSTNISCPNSCERFVAASTAAIKPRMPPTSSSAARRWWCLPVSHLILQTRRVLTPFQDHPAQPQDRLGRQQLRVALGSPASWTPPSATPQWPQTRAARSCSSPVTASMSRSISTANDRTPRPQTLSRTAATSSAGRSA